MRGKCTCREDHWRATSARLADLRRAGPNGPGGTFHHFLGLEQVLARLVENVPETDMIDWHGYDLHNRHVGERFTKFDNLSAKLFGSTTSLIQSGEQSCRGPICVHKQTEICERRGTHVDHGLSFLRPVRELQLRPAAHSC